MSPQPSLLDQRKAPTRSADRGGPGLEPRAPATDAGAARSRAPSVVAAAAAWRPGRRGAGLLLRYGAADSPFGPVVIAASEQGICQLEFTAERDAGALVRTRWPAAALAEDREGAAALAGRAFGRADGALRVALWGTPFQLQVWRALLEIPLGAVSTYGQLARQLGRPAAARAVGQAVGRNPVAWLIPCHRIITAAGALGGYRWGPERKRAILEWEAARAAGGGL